MPAVGGISFANQAKREGVHDVSFRPLVRPVRLVRWHHAAGRVKLLVRAEKALATKISNAYQRDNAGREKKKIAD